MYSSNQTLYHKETKELVALHPENDTDFNWELGANNGLTRVIDEFGKVKHVDIKQYTNFTDYTGRAAASTDEKNTNEYVDITLRKYLITEEEREIKKQQIFEEWKVENLAFLGKPTYETVSLGDKKHTIKNLKKRGYFADGSVCHQFRKWFIKEMNCKYFYKIKGFTEEFNKEFVNRQPYFEYEGRFWLISDNDIEEILIN